MRAKTTCLFILAVFILLEFLPFPVLALVLLQVVLSRPAWFKNLIDRLYAEP